jgi:histidinol-phosphate/aromatic aminotransferase/cobyric acid decarboxylase-like protein
MKKIIPFLFICLSFSGFAQKGYRYSVVPGTDNTFLMTSKEAKAVLTRTGSATVGIAGFRITFISASAAVLTRIF